MLFSSTSQSTMLSNLIRGPDGSRASHRRLCTSSLAPRVPHSSSTDPVFLFRRHPRYATSRHPSFALGACPCPFGLLSVLRLSHIHISYFSLLYLSPPLSRSPSGSWSLIVFWLSFYSLYLLTPTFHLKCALLLNILRLSWWTVSRVQVRQTE